MVLRDLNSTFMFGEDRFGADHDYHGTYTLEGGQTLAPADVRAAVDACYTYLTGRYSDPSYVDDFPAACKALDALTETRALPAAERMRLECVIAPREPGRVPDA